MRNGYHWVLGTGDKGPGTEWGGRESERDAKEKGKIEREEKRRKVFVWGYLLGRVTDRRCSSVDRRGNERNSENGLLRGRYQWRNSCRQKGATLGKKKDESKT